MYKFYYEGCKPDTGEVCTGHGYWHSIADALSALEEHYCNIKLFIRAY